MSTPRKFYQVPSRWSHELYPVDEIFTRELGLAREQFYLELVDSPDDIYTLEARDGMIASNMELGVREGFERLDAILETLKAEKAA